MSLYTTPKKLKVNKIDLPKLTGNPVTDVTILKQQSKTVLLKMCESSAYVLNLCNNDPILNSIILTPDFKN